jgi:ATP-dependent RNA helicase UAP56/SUB2
MVNPISILVDEGKLILHGLTQFYLRIPEEKKFDKLVLLLDTLAFNQVIIFVNRVDRAKRLTDLLKLKLFNPICIHSSLRQEERIKNYDLFKANSSRLLVATDLFGRGIDI